MNQPGGLPQVYILYKSGRRKTEKAAVVCRSIYVFIRTSPFRPDYSNSLTIPLPSPTDDTRQLANIALWGLRQIYKPNYNYAKAGVMLGELVPAQGVQRYLFNQMKASP